MTPPGGNSMHSADTENIGQRKIIGCIQLRQSTMHGMVFNSSIRKEDGDSNMDLSALEVNRCVSKMHINCSHQWYASLTLDGDNAEYLSKNSYSTYHFKTNKNFIYFILWENIVFSSIKQWETNMSLVHKSFDILPREIWLQIISKLRLVFKGRGLIPSAT